MYKRDLKHIGKKRRDYIENQNTDNEQMRVRVLESVFGNGVEEKLVDLKQLNWKHAELLRKFGYTKRLVNIGSVILTDKAFSDWEALCLRRASKDKDNGR